MSQAVAQRVLAKYGLQVVAIDAPQKGYRNTSYAATLRNGERVNLIVYKCEPGVARRIQRTHDAANFLQKFELPVRYPIDERIITLQTGNTRRYAALYNYLPGCTIPWEAYTKHHLKLAGEAMSTLHAAWRLMPTQAFTVAEEYAFIVAHMQAYFSDEPVRQALWQKLGLRVRPSVLHRLRAVLEVCQQLPGQQPLHMDFVRGNLLFRRSQPADRFAHGGVSLAGILDFEKTATGHPLFDVARTLAFLLVDCKYKSPDKIRRYFLHSGYNKHGPQPVRGLRLTKGGQHMNVLEELLNLFLLHDFYKFLRHNPYEFLPQNEHFIRTSNMLRARQMIQ